MNDGAAPRPQSTLKLTQTVQKGGCAAKVAASELRQILKQVRFPAAHRELLVDGGTFDDAAVYQVSPDFAMVQTLDFFTPIVDDPRRFGQIAAANALSDVYAMGGKPKTAMAILAFPIATLPQDVIVEVLQGASDKIAEAHANFVGGHSIDDDTLKFGLSVTGLVRPTAVWTNAKARPGDQLILTKPLGTGTATAALKRGEVTEAEIEPVLASMAVLNNVIDHLTEREGNSVHACTDVTGFGLAGHGMQMANASHVTFEINTNRLPQFPRTMEFLEKGFLTKAHRSNFQYVEKDAKFEALSELQRQLVCDPQTSGGLLLSVAPSLAHAVFDKIHAHFPQAEFVGQVLARGDAGLHFLG